MQPVGLSYEGEINAARNEEYDNTTSFQIKDRGWYEESRAAAPQADSSRVFAIALPAPRRE